MSGDYQVGDWRFTPASGELAPRHGHGAPVRLEPKVAAVLSCLLQQPSRVVAKETLIAAVWPDTFVTDSAVFRHVSELRRLLGDDARRPRYIETVPKRGYRLVANVARLHEPPGKDRPAHPPARVAEGRVRRRRGVLLAAAAVAVLLALPWLWRPAAAPPVAAETSTSGSPPDPVDPATRETLAFARLFEDRVDCASYAKAGELLQSVLERDGGLASVYGSLVDVSVAAAVLGCRPTRAALAELEGGLEAARAARLDAAQQQRALGHLRLWRDRDPDDAGLAFERVRQLAPAGGSDMGYAAALAASGRLDEAIEEGRRALRDEPTHPGTNWALGMLLYFDGRLDEAAEQLRHTLELHPGFAPARNLLGLVLLRRGDTEAALAALRAYDAATTGAQDRFGTIPALVFAAGGDIASATRVRDAWERRARSGWIPPTAMALMYDGLGERARAIEWLQRALDEGDAWSVFLPIDPTFAKLREDPAFPELDSPSSSEKAVAARRLGERRSPLEP